MADRIRVSTAELRTAVEKYNNVKGQIQNAYLQMSNAVREVDVSWNGAASEAYKNQFDLLYKNIEQTELKVQDAVDELLKTAEIYDEQETGISQTFADLDIGTSPFD